MLFCEQHINVPILLSAAGSAGRGVSGYPKSLHSLMWILGIQGMQII